MKLGSPCALVYSPADTCPSAQPIDSAMLARRLFELCGVLALWLGILSADVRAVVDEAGGFDIIASQTNIIQASNPGQDDLESSFNGDANRFARETSERGSLTYEEEQGVDQLSVTLFALVSAEAGQWQLSITVGSRDVVLLTAQQLQDAFAASSVRALSHHRIQAGLILYTDAEMADAITLLFSSNCGMCVSNGEIT